jgi:tetratricopeptide (TPR) repeat protein
MTETTAITALSGEDAASITALTRMIGRSPRFALGFVSINYSALRDQLISELAADPAIGGITVVHLAPTGPGIAPQIEAAASASQDSRPRAVFVVGLENMLEIAGGALPHLANLNLRRGDVANSFPWPVVFWAPEYAIRKFASEAGDFWSGRSALQQIHGTLAQVRRELADINVRLGAMLDSPRLESELVHDLLREVARQKRQNPKAAVAAVRADGAALMQRLRKYADDRGLQQIDLLADKIRYLEDLRDKHDQSGPQSDLVYLAQQLGDLQWRRANYGEAKPRYEYALRLHRNAGHVKGQADCTRGLGWVHLMRAEYEQASRFFAEALRLARSADYRIGEADALRTLGHIARINAEHDHADRLYCEAKAIYEEFGDASERIIRGRVGCLEGRADVAWMRSQYGLAEQLYQQGRDLAVEAEEGHPIPDERGEAGCIEGLGHVEFMRANYDVASEYYEVARELYRRLSHKRGEANSIRAMAEVARIRDDTEGARGLFNSALGIYDEIGHRRGSADAIRGLAHLARAQGNYAAAAKQYRKALGVYREIRHRWGQAGSLEGLGDVARAQGDYDEAAKSYADALRLSREIGDRKGAATVTRNLGDLAWKAGDFGGASELYRQAREIAHSIDDRWGESAFIRDQGDAAWKLRDFPAAEGLYQEARDMSAQAHDRWGEADAICKLGNTAWKCSQPERMAALYQQALFMYRQVGARRGEAESLAFLSRLYRRGIGMEAAEARSQAQLDTVAQEYQERVKSIIEKTGSQDWAMALSSSVSIDDLLERMYAEPARHRPEHRRL